MRYTYAYRTSEGKRLEGSIDAPSRDEAFALLRSDGIRPIKVTAADGSKANGAPTGIRKRVVAIVAVAASLVAAVCTYAFLRVEPPSESEPQDFSVRHQIYGDRSIIENGIATGWKACGLDRGETILASFAQPGIATRIGSDVSSLANSIEASLANELKSDDGELLEYRQLKQIIEGMKVELRQYIAAGGTAEGYARRLVERQNQEAAYYRAAKQELQDARSRLGEDELNALWAEKNAELRAIGLPMLHDPNESR